MLTEKLANDIALAAQQKLQVKTAGLSNRQIAALVGGLGGVGLGLAAPSMGSMLGSAGVPAGADVEEMQRQLELKKLLNSQVTPTPVTLNGSNYGVHFPQTRPAPDIQVPLV